MRSPIVATADVREHTRRKASVAPLAPQAQVGKAAMEASGGYEREWAKAMRKADIEALVVDPKRVRDFARSAGRLAKNDRSMQS